MDSQGRPYDELPASDSVLPGADSGIARTQPGFPEATRISDSDTYSGDEPPMANMYQRALGDNFDQRQQPPRRCLRGVLNCTECAVGGACGCSPLGCLAYAGATYIQNQKGSQMVAGPVAKATCALCAKCAHGIGSAKACAVCSTAGVAAGCAISGGKRPRKTKRSTRNRKKTKKTRQGFRKKFSKRRHRCQSKSRFLMKKH